jgi:preprotein translocase subunit SecA
MKKYWGEFNDNFVKIYGDYFVYELIMKFDNFDEQLRQRKGKPFYIPDQEELFNYIDDNYIEINKEYKNLLKYVTNNIFYGDKEEAESLVEDIHNCCHQDFSLEWIFGLFNERDISFKDENQVNEVIQLVMDMANNIRLWENNGFTPKEIFEIMEMPNLSPLPKGDFIGGSKPNLVSIPGVKSKKIGRNDPCPCGSGKKYKKCCGKLELS